MKYLFLALIILPNYVLCQNLKLNKLTKDDIQAGVKYRYEYNAVNSFYNITLFLFKNGAFRYIQSSFLQNLSSTGKWNILGKNLMLNSDIKKGNVPVSVSFTNDTTDIVNDLKFGVVKNLNGEPLTDAFINVNADSIRCLPIAGSCIGAYNKIDSIRLIFENGFTSRWLKITNNNDQYIIIRVDARIKIESYASFDNFRYLMTANELRAISTK